MVSSVAETPRYVLDACALIAYLNDELGAEIVEELLSLARTSQIELYLAAVNAYELYYDCLKRDPQTAQQLLDDIYALPLTVVESLDRSVMLNAGDYKVAYRVSLADSIALGLAKHLKAHVVSSDHQEFDPLERDGNAQFKWIR